MTAVLQAVGLGKRYRRTWALRDCSVAIPEGRVVALVGPNGAGKTTLLHLATGLLAPRAGEIRVFGAPPANQPGVLARIGFLAQDRPVGRRRHGPAGERLADDLVRPRQRAGRLRRPAPGLPAARGGLRGPPRAAP